MEELFKQQAATQIGALTVQLMDARALNELLAKSNQVLEARCAELISKLEADATDQAAGD